jgi:hypothetical protein
VQSGPIAIKNEDKIKPNKFIYINNNKYIIYGCIIHSGGIQAGHYIYIDYNNGETVKKYDDSNIEEFKGKNNDDGYVYLYKYNGPIDETGTKYLADLGAKYTDKEISEKEKEDLAKISQKTHDTLITKFTENVKKLREAYNEYLKENSKYTELQKEYIESLQIKKKIDFIKSEDSKQRLVAIIKEYDTLISRISVIKSPAAGSGMPDAGSGTPAVTSGTPVGSGMPPAASKIPTAAAAKTPPAASKTPASPQKPQIEPPINFTEIQKTNDNNIVKILWSLLGATVLFLISVFNKKYSTLFRKSTGMTFLISLLIVGSIAVLFYFTKILKITYKKLIVLFIILWFYLMAMEISGLNLYLSESDLNKKSKYSEFVNRLNENRKHDGLFRNMCWMVGALLSVLIFFNFGRISKSLFKQLKQTDINLKQKLYIALLSFCCFIVIYLTLLGNTIWEDGKFNFNFSTNNFFVALVLTFITIFIYLKETQTTEKPNALVPQPLIPTPPQSTPQKSTSPQSTPPQSISDFSLVLPIIDKPTRTLYLPHSKLTRTLYLPYSKPINILYIPKYTSTKS